VGGESGEGGGAGEGGRSGGGILGDGGGAGSGLPGMGGRGGGGHGGSGHGGGGGGGGGGGLGGSGGGGGSGPYRHVDPESVDIQIVPWAAPAARTRPLPLTATVDQDCSGPCGAHVDPESVLTKTCWPCCERTAAMTLPSLLHARPSGAYHGPAGELGGADHDDPESVER